MQNYLMLFLNILKDAIISKDNVEMASSCRHWPSPGLHWTQVEISPFSQILKKSMYIILQARSVIYSLEIKKSEVDRIV